MNDGEQISYNIKLWRDNEYIKRYYSPILLRKIHEFSSEILGNRVLELQRDVKFLNPKIILVGSDFDH